MKLVDLIEHVSWEDVERSLRMNLRVSEGDIEDYRNVFLWKLRGLSPTESKMRICIQWVKPDQINDRGYWDVHGKNGTLQKETEDYKYFKDRCTPEFAESEVSYAIEFNKWDEILGMEIDEETLNNTHLTKADIVAYCIWEITFISFNEDEIQKQADKLKKDAEKIENMSEEELKRNTISLEDLKKKFDDNLNDY